MDLRDLFATGGVGTLVVSFAYVMQQLIKGWQERRQNKDKAASPTTQISDAATANQMLLNTLHSLQRENERIVTEAHEDRARIDILEEARNKDHQMIIGLRAYIRRLMVLLENKHVDVPKAPEYLGLSEGD